MAEPKIPFNQTPADLAATSHLMLSQLQDIVTPDPVGWWPPSQTLIGLMVGIGGILIGLSWYFWTQRKANKYRRQAKSLFDAAMTQATTPKQKLQQANKLLKQVAITTYGRKQVAALSGDAWIDFLKQSASYIDQPEHLQQNLAAIYHADQPLDELELEATLNYVQSWIKGHHK